ncbi:MAG: hypothetical protein WA096_12820, partial [Smithella sp.]
MNTKLLKREIVYIEMGIPELIQSSSKSFARLASGAFYSVIKKLVWCPYAVTTALSSGLKSRPGNCPIHPGSSRERRLGNKGS